MADYISRKSVHEVVNALQKYIWKQPEWNPHQMQPKYRVTVGADDVNFEVDKIPAADVVEAVRCKDCEYSTLPSEFTQRYGKPGTLTCHNRYAPCNRRNVDENDFCSYGKRRNE